MENGENGDESPKELFSKEIGKEGLLEESMSLLDNFYEDNSLADPFDFGTEYILADIMQDDLVQRSLSKQSIGNKTTRNSKSTVDFLQILTNNPSNQEQNDDSNNQIKEIDEIILQP